MGDPTDTILNLVIIGGALFVGGTVLLPMLSQMAAGATPATTTTVDISGNPVTVPATTTTTTTGNTLQDLINQLTGQTTTPAPAPVTPDTTLQELLNQLAQGQTGTPISTQPGADPSLCKSKYYGKCDTECKNGVNSTCTSCRIACGLTSNFASAEDIYDDTDMPMPIGYYVTMS